MQFRMTSGPFQRSKRSTKAIMQELFLVLAAVYLYSIVFYFIKAGAGIAVRAILILVFSLIGSLAVDVIMALIAKKKGKEIFEYILSSFSYITAIILALILPAGTTYYATIIGSAFATFIGKMVFGGFGYNAANPAGVGRIFMNVAFTLTVPKVTGLVDAVSGATFTTATSWAEGILPANLGTLFFGNYLGTIGETSALVLIIAGIYMCVRGLCDYRQMVSYVGGVFLISLIFALLSLAKGVAGTAFAANPFVYALTHVLSGGLLFGAVFMITDPVTGPTSQFGKIIYGLGAAFLTVLIRVNGNLPEGVVYSIVFMNLLTPIIENKIVGKSTDNLLKKIIIVAAFIIVGALLVWAIGLVKLAAVA